MKKLLTSLIAATAFFSSPALADVRQQFQQQQSTEASEQATCMWYFNNAQFHGNSNELRKNWLFSDSEKSSRKYVDEQGRVTDISYISGKCTLREEWRQGGVVGNKREYDYWYGTYFIEEDGLIDYQQHKRPSPIDRVVYEFL